MHVHTHKDHFIWNTSDKLWAAAILSVFISFQSFIRSRQTLRRIGTLLRRIFRLGETLVMSHTQRREKFSERSAYEGGGDQSMTSSKDLAHFN